VLLDQRFILYNYFIYQTFKIMEENEEYYVVVIVTIIAVITLINNKKNNINHFHN